MFENLAHVRADEHGRLVRELQARPRVDRAEPRPQRLRRLLHKILEPPAPAAGRHVSPPRVTIRAAAPGDQGELRTLAQLSERRTPAGRVLVAEVDAEIVAALPLDGGAPVTNILRSTDDVVQLLELRSAQVRRAEQPQAA